MTAFTNADIAVGRVVSEDAGFVLLEIAKDETRELTIEDGDRFYTVLFVQMEGDKPTFRKPWES